MRKVFVIFTFLLVGLPTLSAQPQHRVAEYDEDDGLPHGHLTQLLQDDQGFIWIATWNGLCRYDGYDFHTFKPQAGDGCHMTTDRYRDVALRPDGQMVCRVDDDYYLFDTRTYRFRDLTAEEAQQAPDDLKRYRQSRRRDGALVCYDRQGNQWSVTDTGLRKVIFSEQRTQRLDLEPKAEVKCLFADRQQRYWVATKDDGAVRVYAGADNHLLGYLGADGRLHQQYTRFGAAVYSMYQSADGTLWLGTKPDGLYRLTENAPQTFKIDHFTDLPNTSIYCITEDRYGRLWLATLGGGVCYTIQQQAAHPRFVVPKGYPGDSGQRVHFLRLVRQGSMLMAATTDGLIVARLEKDADRMTFRCHQRETDRSESLSSSATMDIMEDGSGRLYVSTESGGINRIEGDELTADRLVFRHYTTANHQLPNDVTLSLTPLRGGGMMVTSPRLIMLLDSMGRQRVLDARYFLEDYRFTEAHPLQLNDTTWLFGLTDGAFMTTSSQMYRTAYQPPLVLTSITVQGGSDFWAVSDTLTLQPQERSVTIRFAALDYSAPERISYAFRLLPNQQWNYIGHDRSATLLDLEPGTYRLEIRSTDADGVWQDNIRTLTLIVKPTFWEAWYGQFFIVLLVVAALATIVYTLLYIRRIKRKQRETLEAYLALMEHRDGQQSQPQVAMAMPATPAPPAAAPSPQAMDPMLERVMAFIEQNISDSDVSVGDMAAAAATSRSGLQRKLKQTMGITPQDLLREARIKHAGQLLRQTDKTVSEVAYASGFTDPKYFSRCFKQSTGQSPTEYKRKDH